MPPYPKEQVRNGKQTKITLVIQSQNKINITTNHIKEEFDEATEALVVPYLQPVALADIYPVPALIDYYIKIANLIDDEKERRKINHKDTKYTKKEAREDNLPKLIT